MEVVIAGEKVLLRPWRLEDAEGLLALWTDGEVMRYVGYPNGTSATPVSVADAILRSRLVRSIERGYYRLAVVRRGTDEFLGEAAVGRIMPDGTSYPDIKLLPRHWGQGFGTEALGLVVDFTFTFTPATRIAVQPHVQNLAARRLYSKLGFVQTGSEKRVDPPPDPKGVAPVTFHEFVLSRGEWLGRAPAATADGPGR